MKQSIRPIPFNMNDRMLIYWGKDCAYDAISSKIKVSAFAFSYKHNYPGMDYTLEFASEVSPLPKTDAEQ